MDPDLPASIKIVTVPTLTPDSALVGPGGDRFWEDAQYLALLQKQYEDGTITESGMRQRTELAKRFVKIRMGD